MFLSHPLYTIFCFAVYLNSFNMFIDTCFVVTDDLIFSKINFLQTYDNFLQDIWYFFLIYFITNWKVSSYSTVSTYFLIHLSLIVELNWFLFLMLNIYMWYNVIDKCALITIITLKGGNITLIYGKIWRKMLLRSSCQIFVLLIDQS